MIRSSLVLRRDAIVIIMIIVGVKVQKTPGVQPMQISELQIVLIILIYTSTESGILALFLLSGTLTAVLHQPL